MCIGDTVAGDTLHLGEQLRIGAAAEHLPGHRLAIHRNDDGIVWAVLDPRTRHELLLRFTICRIAPCVMVLVEDGQARRRFHSLASVDAAMDFVRASSDEAMAGDNGTGSRALH